MEVKNKTYGYLQCCLCEGSCTVTNTWGKVNTLFDCIYYNLHVYVPPLHL